MIFSSPVARAAPVFALAVLMLTAMDACARFLIAREGYSVVQVVWARYAAQTALLALIFLPSLPRRLRTRHPGLQLLRSLLLFAATCVFFTSLAFLELATVAAVFAVAPLIVTILGAVVLKEFVGPRRWAAVLIGLGGVLVILRPGGDLFQAAALLPVLAAAFYASFQIATRRLGADEPLTTTLLYTAGAGAVLSSFALPFHWTTPQPMDALLMVGMGAFAAAGHFLLVYALGMAEASALAPFNYLNFVWATILGWLVFAEVPDAMTFVGAGVIVAAGLQVWRRERAGARR